VPEYEEHFMEMLQYDPHLNTKKLKVNKFVFGLNVNICAKVSILIPQTLHDAFYKALIDEEELIHGGQSRTPVRPTGHATFGAQQHQTLDKHPSRYQFSTIGSMFMAHGDRRLSRRIPTEDHSTNNNVVCSSNSLGLFRRTDQGSRLVGHQFLLWGPEY
jgi:hypothetical protein